MTADYTRETFRRERHFSGVRQQQGRVHMDADWNELVDIGHHVARTTTGDVVGPTGMPAAAPGFAITAAPNGADLLIGPGRAYVGGILVEHDLGAAHIQEVSGTGANTIWQVMSGHRLRLGEWVADPLSDLAVVASLEPPQAGDEGRQRFKLNKAFGGGSKIVQAFSSVLAQPFLPGAALPQANDSYLAYLDVSEREITVLEDPLIAEVALGGVDTAIRTQVIWQVKLLALAPLVASGELDAPPMCKSFPPGAFVAPKDRMLLVATATAASAETDPCELPAQGGYRSLENHLYRVEVHRGGDSNSGNVLVKWSPDNAIHRTRLLDVADGSLVVEEVGKDDVTSLATDDWVEVRDEGRILRGEPGFFVEIGEVIGTRLGIRTILDPVTQQPLIQNSQPNADALPKQGLVRRWEGGAPVAIAPNQMLKLERGIEITLAPATGHADVGDYWLIPARSLSAAIEWPVDAATNGAAALPPHGITHAYCPLAILEKTDAGWAVKDDCRPIFPPLTKLESFFYLGGDGQEATPDPTASVVTLDSPLRVGVAHGRVPINGRPVRFRVTDASDQGRLSPTPGTPAADVILNTPTELVLRTGGHGVAAAAFAIPNTRQFNHVVAELLNASDPAQADMVHLPIHFTATTSVAAGGGPDPGIRVVGILRAKSANDPPGMPINAYEVLAPEILARGLLFETDGPVDKASLAPGQAGHVTIDLPFPVERIIIEMWWQDILQPREAVFGSTAIKLSGELTTADTGRGPQHGILWMPAEPTRKWLTDRMARAFERLELPFKVPAQAILHGNRIYSPEDKPRYLDGDLYLHHAQANGIHYASGDGRKGGDLALPFFIGRAG